MYNRIVWLFIVLLLSSMAIADTGYFSGNGESVFPLSNTQIEMIEENVLIYPLSTKWKAECIFVFHNTGIAENVLMGFPDFPNDEWVEMDSVELRRDTTIQDFECYVDGQSIDWAIKLGIKNPSDASLDKYPRVFTWPILFKEDQIRTVKVSYVFGGYRSNNDELRLSYVLKTGSLWKGQIKKGVITIVLNLYDSTLVSNIQPCWYKVHGDSLIWTFQNLKPKQDITLGTHIFLPLWYRQAIDVLENRSLPAIKECLDMAYNNSYISMDISTVPRAYNLADSLLRIAQHSTGDIMLVLRICTLLNKHDLCDSMVDRIYAKLKNGTINNEIDYRFVAKKICAQYLGNYQMARELLNNYLSTFGKKHSKEQDDFTFPELVKSVQADFDTIKQDSISENKKFQYNNTNFQKQNTKEVSLIKHFRLVFDHYQIIILPAAIIFMGIVYLIIRIRTSVIDKRKDAPHPR